MVRSALVDTNEGQWKKCNAKQLLQVFVCLRATKQLPGMRDKLRIDLLEWVVYSWMAVAVQKRVSELICGVFIRRQLDLLSQKRRKNGPKNLTS